MLVTEQNINEVKIGGWAYHCCELDLAQVDEKMLQDIKYDAEDPMFNYVYHNNKIDALTECFATLCREHLGIGSIVDCAEAIKDLYGRICDELNLPKN